MVARTFQPECPRYSVVELRIFGPADETRRVHIEVARVFNKHGAPSVVRVAGFMINAEAATGIRLTESYAMWPAASISGLYFSHPQARYFAVDLITRDQVESYAGRKGLPVKQVERWLAPNLAYEAD